MSQNDFNLANQGFPQMRADMNSAFQALASNSSGATAPGTTYAYQFWYDTSTDLLKMRNADNDAWITLAAFDQSADEWQIRSSVIQAADSAGVEIKTDEGTTRITVADDGTVTLANDLEVTGSVSGSNIPGAGSFSNRNKIINGNFDIWQRGTSLSAGTGVRYLADRWYSFGVGSTAAPSRQAFTLGQTNVPNEPAYFHRVIVASSAGASNLALFRQPIESVRTFAGQTVTLSFWAKANAAKDIAVEFVQRFGTGGSPSTNVDAIGVTTVSLTTSWQKFTVTASIPSISYKTLGTDGNSDLTVNFWFDAGSDWNSRTNSLGQQSGTFDIAQVQLEAGDVATPFEVRPIGQELALCQRYYYAPGIAYFIQGNSVGAGSNIYTETFFPTSMRVTPTVTAVWSNGINAAAGTIAALGAYGATAQIVATTSGDFAAKINWQSFDAEL